MPKRDPSLTPSSALLDSWGRRNRKHPDKACANCGTLFRPKRADTVYCSRPCLWANNGKNQMSVSECWWTDQKGYVGGFVRVDGRKVKVRKHRWLMEQSLGRRLAATEDVHHINGNKQDNRLENLQLIDHGQHSTLSNLSRAVIKKAKGE